MGEVKYFKNGISGKVPKKEGKGYECKHTDLPFADCVMSKGRKGLIRWLIRKGIFNSIFLDFKPEGKAVTAKRLCRFVNDVLQKKIKKLHHKIEKP